MIARSVFSPPSEQQGDISCCDINTLAVRPNQQQVKSYFEQPNMI